MNDGVEDTRSYGCIFMERPTFDEWCACYLVWFGYSFLEYLWSYLLRSGSLVVCIAIYNLLEQKARLNDIIIAMLCF